MVSLLRRITSFSDAMRIKKLAQAQTPHWWHKNKTGKDCTRLIYLNSSAGQSEKDEGVLGTGKIGAIAGCVIGQHKANKAGAIGSKDIGLVDERRSSLTVKITGAPMRRMIDWIVGTDETVLDVAIDGLVAILGASLLTQALHVVIEAL